MEESFLMKKLLALFFVCHFNELQTGAQADLFYLLSFLYICALQSWLLVKPGLMLRWVFRKLSSPLSLFHLFPTEGWSGLDGITGIFILIVS